MCCTIHNSDCDVEEGWICGDAGGNLLQAVGARKRRHGVGVECSWTQVGDMS